MKGKLDLLLRSLERVPWQLSGAVGFVSLIGVGFAAETENVETHARSKLNDKQVDMIAANHVGQADNPVFGSDTNALNVYWPEDNGHRKIESADKRSVAYSLLGIIAERLKASNSL